MTAKTAALVVLLLLLAARPILPQDRSESERSGTAQPTGPTNPTNPTDSESVKHLPRDIERRLFQESLSFEQDRSEAYRAYLAILMTPQGLAWLNAESKVKESSSALQSLQKTLSDYCLQFGGMQLNMKEARCELVPPGTVQKLLQGEKTK